MKLSVPPLGQKDSRWSRKRLNTTTLTISNYGCLLICHSMMLRYYGHDLLPDALNAIYKEKGVFDPGGLINFYAAAGCFENVNADEFYPCYTSPCDLSKIDHYLEEKKPVIAAVDFDANPAKSNDWHFVLIIGKENDSYLINDPWTGETYFFESRYGDPVKMIYGLRLYSGQPKEVKSAEDEVSDLKDKVTSCTEALAGKNLEVNDFRERLETQERDNQDLGKQILKARNQRDQAVREKETVEKQVETLSQDLLTAQEEVTGLRTRLRATIASQIRGMSSWERIKLCFFGRGVSEKK